MMCNTPWHTLLLLISITFTFFAYFLLKKKLSYWKDRNIPGPQPVPLFGNLWKALTLQVGIGQLLKEFYDSEKGPVMGIFTFDEPVMLIRSREIAKQICLTDFQLFSDRVTGPPKHNNYTSNFLLMNKNPKWKSLRTKLTPLFSSAKLKTTFDIIKNVGDTMVTFLKNKPGLHEGKQLLHEYATEVMSRCFFGIHANCFTNKKSLIKQKTDEMFETTFRNSISQSAYFFKPKLVDLFHLEFFTRSVEQFFVKLFWDCMEKVENGQIRSFSFIGLLKEIRNKDPSFDDYKMAAQGLAFFGAGTETTSSAISFCAYELCKHPNIQSKLREEIVSIINKHGELTYEGVQEMKYLELCILESLRKYPPIPFLDRKSKTDYKIPGTNIVIKKGTGIYIPTLGIQNDNKYFPNAEKYYPERFIEKPEDAKMIFSFGFGPRSCIGARFGMLSAKIALVSILRNFELKPVPTTPTAIKICPKAVTLASIVGLPMAFVPI